MKFEAERRLHMALSEDPVDQDREHYGQHHREQKHGQAASRAAES
jgi:hypothetical protein